MVYSVSTQHHYISFGYTFRLLQNHLQANFNYREVHSVCTYIMYLPVVNIGLKMVLYRPKHVAKTNVLVLCWDGINHLIELLNFTMGRLLLEFRQILSPQTLLLLLCFTSLSLLLSLNSKKNFNIPSNLVFRNCNLQFW